MPMFQVQFQVHWTEVVEMGSAIVFADNSETARGKVIADLDLVPHRTKFTIEPVLSDVLMLGRSSVQKPATPIPQIKPARELKQVGSLVVDNGKIKHSRNANMPRQYMCRAFACIKATGDEHALHMFSDAIVSKLRGDEIVTPVNGLTLNCDFFVDQKSVGRR